MSAENATTENATQLLPHQQRVVDEHAQLNERIIRLSTFLTAPPRSVLLSGEVELLELQLSIMRSLSRTLEMRLRLWGVQP